MSVSHFYILKNSYYICEKWRICWRISDLRFS